MAQSSARLRIRNHVEEPGKYYGTPKELRSFLLPSLPFNPPRAAITALRANAELLGLEDDLTGLTLRASRAGLGSFHVILSQRHLGTRVHRAYATVHMNSEKRVYLVKNRIVPAHLLPRKPADRIDKASAHARAMRAMRKPRRGLHTLEHEVVWFPLGRKLRYAHKFRIKRVAPPEEWIIYVDAENGKILSRYDNLSLATGRARVFDPNPVVTLRDWNVLLDRGKPVRRIPEAAYHHVTFTGLANSGELSGPHVTTAPTKNRLRKTDFDFTLKSHQPGFEEVMAYFHVDRAVRYVRSLGYTGARSIFPGPLQVNARATRQDQSWYSSGEGLLSFGTGHVDDAEDGETILHEFGHALQDAICHDFGQSKEAAAMGEGFGDYFAASFFAGTKEANRAKRWVPTVMSWDGVLDAPRNDPKRPPCLRRMDSRLTYKDFNNRADEHDNGPIWSATLWSIWRAVGREVADRIIIDSHFQLDGFTTFARGARAILDADRNLFGGRHVEKLEEIFRRRGIGPLR